MKPNYAMYVNNKDKFAELCKKQGTSMQAQINRMVDEWIRMKTDGGKAAEEKRKKEAAEEKRKKEEERKIKACLECMKQYPRQYWTGKDYVPPPCGFLGPPDGECPHQFGKEIYFKASMRRPD